MDAKPDEEKLEAKDKVPTAIDDGTDVDDDDGASTSAGSGSSSNIVGNVLDGFAAAIFGGTTDDDDVPAVNDEEAQSSSDKNVPNNSNDDQVNEQMDTKPGEEELEAMPQTTDSDSSLDTNDKVLAAIEDIPDSIEDISAVIARGITKVGAIVRGISDIDIPAAIDGDTNDDANDEEIMNSRQHEIEATPSDDGEKNSHQKARRVPYGMSLSSDVNMTTCYKHCQHFFNKYPEIVMETLFYYWMMAGYLHPASSISVAMENAKAILADIKTKWNIKYSKLTGKLSLAPTSQQNPIQCRHKGCCILGNLGFIDLIDLPNLPLPKLHKRLGWLKSLLDDDLSYAATFNPTTENLSSFFRDKNIKHLNLLLIRGCEQSPLSTLLSSTRLKYLTVLEISGSCLTFFPTEAMSKLTRLHSLNLSDLPIQKLPYDSFDKLTQLRWLIIRGCSKLRSFPSIDHLMKLEVLDLSHWPCLQQPIFLEIRYPQLQMLDVSYTPVLYGFRELSTPNLTHLSLRGSNFQHLFLQVPNLLNLQVLDLSECEHLVSLLPLMNIPCLEQFNLSGCTCLMNLPEGIFDQMTCLLYLDLSWTKLNHLPSLASLTSLRTLSLRGLELDSIEILSSLSISLVELDFTGLKIGSSQELRMDSLMSLENLEVLNLSQTFVEKLPDMSKLVRLKELILANCQHFRVIPSLLALTDLETLDLSLPHDCSINNRQLESEEAEGQGAFSFSLVPMTLRKLVLTNRYGVQKIFPNTLLENLELLDLRGTDVTDWDSKLPAKQTQERIIKPVEIHIIRHNPEDQPSSFDHFEDASMKLGTLISDIEKNVNSAKATITIEAGANEDFMQHIEMICANLMYIQKNIDMLKSYRHWKSKEGLLHDLMGAATYLSRANLQFDCDNFKKLHRLILKVKLLVPPEEINESKASGLNNKKKKRSLFVRIKNKENVANIVKDMKGIGFDLFPSYRSLSDFQRHCLLCFAIFPFNEEGDKNASVLKSLVIEKKVLIYWWVGEGFIDPHHEENVDDLEPSSNENPNPDTRRDEENEQFSTTKGLKKSKTIEKIGKQILKVLVQKQFIKPVMKKGRESGSYSMHPFIHTFVIERAREAGFFDIDQESCNLNPTFTLSQSQRACLLLPHDKSPSSCVLWAKYTSSPKMLEIFKTVKTLFNVNETMIDIRREWFSQMKNLYVLHLGSWRSENTDLIELEDEKFLESLKRMKKLRLLSLQGLPTIMRLPDSVCHLTNLLILDLNECSYLEELPTDIGSLKSLTHLDISNCPLLTKLPKGISLLSKLEVLRGLVISDQHSSHVLEDRNPSNLSRWWEKTKQYTIKSSSRFKKNEACTVKDLLKLERLRELSLVVSIRTFPDDEELKVLKEMKQLRKLKILWKRSIHTEDKSVATDQEGWKGHTTEEKKCLDNIEKLELWCFPNEIAPRSLNPSELKNLKRLHIIGGNLSKMQQGISEDKWNVTSLCLEYLQNLNIQWSELNNMFPRLKHLDKYQCDQLVDFPCNYEEGVWRSTS